MVPYNDQNKRSRIVQSKYPNNSRRNGNRLITITDICRYISCIYAIYMGKRIKHYTHNTKAQYSYTKRKQVKAFPFLLSLIYPFFLQQVNKLNFVKLSRIQKTGSQKSDSEKQDCYYYSIRIKSESKGIGLQNCTHDKCDDNPG